jgi:hypothetical protein
MKQFKQIESIDFAVQFSVVNSFKLYLMALQENTILRQLIDNLRKHPANIQKVAERLSFVLNSEHNAEFMHPQDEAIAAYLYVLSKSDTSEAVVAASQILAFQNLWWAKQLATSVLENVRHTGAFTVEAGNWSENFNVEISFAENSTIGILARVAKEKKAPSELGAENTQVVRFQMPRAGLRRLRKINYSASSGVYEERVS